MRVKLTGRGTVTIPKDLRAGLPEGTVMDAVVRDDGVLELRPQSGDPSQAWFWTRRWQRMERQADQDYAAGRYQTFDDMEDFLADLDAHAVAAKPERTANRGA
ncbi:MAG: AbrB/MazE/SpoVT family DNA-binding domain-containing protein [Chloroflexota bacterium]